MTCQQEISLTNYFYFSLQISMILLKIVLSAKRMNKKILWVMGAKDYKDTGLGNYSLLYIHALESRGFQIHQHWIPYNLRSAKRLFYKFFILPIVLFSKSKDYKWVVLWVEDYAFLYPFIRTNKVLIVHIVTQNTSYKRLLREKIYLFLERKNISKFKTIVSVSNYVKNQLIENQYITSQEQCKTIYNPIYLAKYKAPPSLSKKELFKKYQIPLLSQTQYLLYVGSEETRKNVITLLKLMSFLKDKKYYFIKLGPAAREENRKIHLDYIQAEQLQNIKLIDQIQKEDIANFYKYSNIYVYPSLFEGFGRTPIEAQASGLPVISTKGGALQEVLGDSALIIQHPVDINEWIAAISQMEQTETRETFIQKGYENAERFSIEGGIQEWEKLLNQD